MWKGICVYLTQYIGIRIQQKSDNILVFLNTWKHTTGDTSGTGTVYPSGAPASPRNLVEYVFV